tara:strand:+ start:768 stop:1163 length:396 start_codon:yes stop_codon:yes gene_type:complete
MEDCISQYGELMWSIVRKYSRNQSDAEDLVQEIFTSLWKAAPRFDPKHGTETTFIGVLARLPALDWPRKQGRRPDFEPLSNDHNEMSNSSPSNATAINLGIVMKALENLPADIQTLFRYHFEKGLSHRKNC